MSFSAGIKADKTIVLTTGEFVPGFSTCGNGIDLKQIHTGRSLNFAYLIRHNIFAINYSLRLFFRRGNYLGRQQNDCCYACK